MQRVNVKSSTSLWFFFFKVHHLWYVFENKRSVAKWLRCWTLVLRVPGSRTTCFSWLFVSLCRSAVIPNAHLYVCMYVCMYVSLDKALYFNCSVVWRSHKAVNPIWSTFHTLSDVKELHGLFKRVGESSPVLLTVCQNMSLPLGPEWARAVAARLSPPCYS